MKLTELQGKIDYLVEGLVLRIEEELKDPKRKMTPERLAAITEKLVRIRSLLPKARPVKDDGDKFNRLMAYLETTDQETAAKVLEACLTLPS